MKTLLMSSKNPEGFTLEAVLTQLKIEILAKNKKIESDDSEQAQIVRANNNLIIANLEEAYDAQINSMAELEALSPNHKPTDKPRIG